MKMNRPTLPELDGVVCLRVPKSVSGFGGGGGTHRGVPAAAALMKRGHNSTSRRAGCVLLSEFIASSLLASLYMRGLVCDPGPSVAARISKHS
jgi:hypothetical protein